MPWEEHQDEEREREETRGREGEREREGQGGERKSTGLALVVSKCARHTRRLPYLCTQPCIHSHTHTHTHILSSYVRRPTDTQAHKADTHMHTHKRTYPHTQSLAHAQTHTHTRAHSHTLAHTHKHTPPYTHHTCTHKRRHFHLDHIASLPYLTERSDVSVKHIYMTPPTKSVAHMLLTDYVRVGTSTDQGVLYDEKVLMRVCMYVCIYVCVCVHVCMCWSVAVNTQVRAGPPRSTSCLIQPLCMSNTRDLHIHQHAHTLTHACIQTHLHEP